MRDIRLLLGLALIVIGLSCKPTQTEPEATSTPTAPPNCRVATECRQASPAFARAYNDRDACRGSDMRVCLVPMGWLPKVMVDGLVAYYASEYNLTLHVLPTIELPPGFDKGQMLSADRLRASFIQTYPGLANDPEVNLIGLTATYIYTAEWPGGSFGQTYPTAGGTRRHAMLSIAMLGPLDRGPTGNALRDRRIRVLLNRPIARGHFDLPENNDRGSLLYHTISSVGQLDLMDERIPR